ncbi:hypothetical protein KUTG_01820 [Kutzneria sp. 744]|nr:hypothetical protein KUTG_01820 [Kutzneria sp. 744]
MVTSQARSRPTDRRGRLHRPEVRLERLLRGLRAGQRLTGHRLAGLRTRGDLRQRHGLHDALYDL